MKKSKALNLLTALLVMAVCFTNTSITSQAAPKQTFTETFSITKKAFSMNEGEYAAVETSGVTQPLEWSSANAKIATVNTEGVVYGAKQGSTKIKAKSGDTTKAVNVRVIRSTLKLNKEALTLYVGGDGATSFKLKGTVRGAGKGITFESSNPQIAAVDEKGNVTAVSEGTALITARANNNYAYCRVNVLEKGITLNNSSLNLATKGVGSSIKVLADVVGPKKSVKWTTSDKKVATVSGGTVRGRKEGTAVITATANGMSASCYVTVYGPETFETIVGNKVRKNQVFTVYGLSESQVTLYSGMKKAETKQLKSSAPAKDKVRWISSDESVAQVTDKGKVTAVGEGTAYISVASDVNPGFTSGKCRVDVKAVSVDIAEDSVSVKTKGAKQKYTLTSTVTGRKKNIAWKSSNSKVATVSKGVVTGKKEGTAVITATANGVSDTVTVNVVAYDDANRLADEAETPAVHVHTWGDWKVTVEAPAGGVGTESRYCKTCKAVQNRTYTAPEKEEPKKDEEQEDPTPGTEDPVVVEPYTRNPEDYQPVVSYSDGCIDGKVHKWKKSYQVRYCDCGKGFETKDALYSHLETMAPGERDEHLWHSIDSLRTGSGRAESVWAYAYYRCNCGFKTAEFNEMRAHCAESSDCALETAYVEVDSEDAPNFYNRDGDGQVKTVTKYYLMYGCTPCGAVIAGEKPFMQHAAEHGFATYGTHITEKEVPVDWVDPCKHDWTSWRGPLTDPKKKADWCRDCRECGLLEYTDTPTGDVYNTQTGEEYHVDEDPQPGDGSQAGDKVPAPYTRSGGDYDPIIKYDRLNISDATVITYGRVEKRAKCYMVLVCGCGEKFETRDALYSHLDPMTAEDRDQHIENSEKLTTVPTDKMKQEIAHKEEVWLYTYHKCSCGFEDADPDKVLCHEGKSQNCYGPQTVYVEVDGQGALDYREEVDNTVPAPIPRESGDYEPMIEVPRLFIYLGKPGERREYTYGMKCDCGEIFETRDAFYSHLDPMTVTERKAHSKSAMYSDESPYTRDNLDMHHRTCIYIREFWEYSYYKCDVCGYNTIYSEARNAHQAEHSAMRRIDVECGPDDCYVWDPSYTGHDKNQTGDQTQTGDENQTGDDTQTGDENQVGDENQTGDNTQIGDQNQTGDQTQTGDNTQTGDDTQTGDENQTGDQNQTGDTTQTGDENQTGDNTQTGDENQTGDDEHAGKTLVVKQIPHWTCLCGEVFESKEAWREHALEYYRNNIGGHDNYTVTYTEEEVWE